VCHSLIKNEIESTKIIIDIKKKRKFMQKNHGDIQM